MDISLLRYFLSVSETQSIRESATLIGISPAGLSKGIKNLEHKLGCALIESHGRGIRLTRAGTELAVQLRPKLNSLEETLYKHELKGKEATPLRIATFEVFSTHLIAKAIQSNEKFTSTEILECVPGEIEEALLQNRADIGISINPAPRAGLSFLKVTAFHSRIFVGAKSKFLNLDFKELPFVVPFPPAKGSVSRAIGLDGWPAEKPRKISYRVSMMETALALCKLNKAAGFFAEPVVALYNEHLQSSHKLVPHLSRITGAENLEVFIITRAGEEETAAVKFIAKELRMISKLEVISKP